MIKDTNIFKICNIFWKKTMKALHDFYLKLDILLLANGFEKFRNNRLKNYGLSSSYYLSALALSWVEILNIKEAGLEIFPDADM